jgi:hypothetical protein
VFPSNTRTLRAHGQAEDFPDEAIGDRRRSWCHRRGDLGHPACELQVVTDYGRKVLVSRPVMPAELAGGSPRPFIVPFALDDTAFGAELRVLSAGRGAVSARLHVDLDQV